MQNLASRAIAALRAWASGQALGDHAEARLGILEHRHMPSQLSAVPHVNQLTTPPPAIHRELCED